jgi:hypothetical protein
MDPFVCSEKIHVVVKWKRVILNQIHGLQRLHFSFDLVFFNSKLSSQLKLMDWFLPYICFEKYYEVASTCGSAFLTAKFIFFMVNSNILQSFKFI